MTDLLRRLRQVSDLFVNQNGRVVCLEHGGGYLRTYMNAHPDATSVDTPLDSWERLLMRDVEDHDASCEDCPRGGAR
jgi:hypothetical protein